MSSSSSEELNFPTTIIYNKLFSSSSESFEEIPSVPSSENVKMLLYQQGLYDPGSGEICTKYVSMSDSTVLRHPYYNYPGVKDPGIKEALLNPGEVFSAYFIFFNKSSHIKCNVTTRRVICVRVYKSGSIDQINSLVIDINNFVMMFLFFRVVGMRLYLNLLEGSTY